MRAKANEILGSLLGRYWRHLEGGGKKETIPGVFEDELLARFGKLKSPLDPTQPLCHPKLILLPAGMTRQELENQMKAMPEVSGRYYVGYTPTAEPEKGTLGVAFRAPSGEVFWKAAAI